MGHYHDERDKIHLLLVQDQSCEMCPGFTELAVGVWAGEEAGRSCSPHKHVLQTSSLHSFAFAVSSACRGRGFLWKLLGSLWKRIRNSHFL